MSDRSMWSFTCHPLHLCGDHRIEVVQRRAVVALMAAGKHRNYWNFFAKRRRQPSQRSTKSSLCPTIRLASKASGVAQKTDGFRSTSFAVVLTRIQANPSTSSLRWTQSSRHTPHAQFNQDFDWLNICQIVLRGSRLSPWPLRLTKVFHRRPLMAMDDCLAFSSLL